MLVSRLRPGDTLLALDVARRFKLRTITPEYAAEFLARPTHLLIVAHEEGEAWGFLLAYILPRLDRDSAKLFIYEIEVAAEQRRRGIGRALIAAALEFAKAEGMMSAFVLTNAANAGAMAFYAATGAQIAHGDDVLFEYNLHDQASGSVRDDIRITTP